MTAGKEEPRRYCGRTFSLEELEWIRRLVASERSLNRTALSRVVCHELGWLRADGRPKEMSCRVAMLRMHRDGLLSLPAPLKRNGNGRIRPRLSFASAPREPLWLPEAALSEVALRVVDTGRDSSLWNELIERYHYLGYKPLPGAQSRYFAHRGTDLLAALGFGAAAWKLAPRDRFIGWSAQERERNLHFIVNNARFLILPWVSAPNLASRLLALVARRLPRDWQSRYGYRPLLLETFVERERFQGTSYRAANWLDVGQTQGRGKLDRKKLRLLPLKRVFLYPLHRRFRELLRSPS